LESGSVPSRQTTIFGGTGFSGGNIVFLPLVCCRLLLSTHRSFLHRSRLP
jgi:hypothetical protein